MNDIMFDVRPMLEAHQHNRVGEVAFELCKLAAFMKRYDDTEPIDDVGDTDEERALLDMPQV